MQKYLSKKWIAMGLAFLCTVLWGSAYPVIKLAYRQLSIDAVGDRLMFAGVRFALAGVMVFVLAFIIRRRFPAVDPKKWGWVLLYGAVQTGLMYLFNYIGVANTSATKTSILTALSAFLSVLFAPLFFKDEKLSVYKIIGIVLGIAGIAVVNLSSIDASFSFFGEGFVMIATVLNTAGGFIGKKISRGKVFETTAYQLMFGGALLIVFALIAGGSMVIRIESLLFVGYLAFVSAAAFSLWTALLVYNEAGRILIFNLMIPVTGAFWSYLILGEREIFDPMYLLSVVLIAAGIILVNSYRKPAENST